MDAAFECVLELDEEQYLEIVLQGMNVQRLREDPGGWIADEGFMDLSGYYLEALVEVTDCQVGQTRILMPATSGDGRPPSPQG